MKKSPSKMLKLKSSTPSNQLMKLLVKCDNNEQYSRRSCLRIHKVEVKQREGRKVEMMS